MKPFLILSVLSLLTLTVSGADAPSLHLKPKDIERLELRLAPDSKPQVRVYILGSKLGETQEVVQNNLGTPIFIYMNDTLVVKPTLKEPLQAKIHYLTLTFADFDSAAQVARGFVPTN